MTRQNNEHLRADRDRLLLYIYERGAGSLRWEVKIEDAKRELGLDRQHYQQAYSVLRAQTLLGRSSNDSISINELGQREAEKLSPEIAMRNIDIQPGEIRIQAHGGSIVQVAGAHSRLSGATGGSHSNIAELLDGIAAELPSLDLHPDEKSNANSLLSSIRDGMSVLNKASLQVLAAALASVLTSAGSSMGQRLLDAIS